MSIAKAQALLRALVRRLPETMPPVETGLFCMMMVLAFADSTA